MNISFPIPMKSYCSGKEMASLKEQILSLRVVLSYFFCNKTEFLSFQNNKKNLDPSYKMDLDF